MKHDGAADRRHIIHRTLFPLNNHKILSLLLCTDIFTVSPMGFWGKCVGVRQLLNLVGRKVDMVGKRQCDPDEYEQEPHMLSKSQ